MKITEIITNPPRDEYLDNHNFEFKNAVTVASIRSLELRRSDMDDGIVYGLFNTKDELVGYLQLDKYHNNIYTVRKVQLANAYKAQGFGTFLYDYAVMNDKLSILSDETNTGGIHVSKNLWLRLKSNNRYQIVGFDTVTDSIIPNATAEMIYNNEPNTRWLAIPPGATINESLTRIQRNMRDRYVVWYGPGTTSEDYFNY